jgi:hypothetical protein
MGIEYRKKTLYYYRKERVNGKVVSHYCGRADGDHARLWGGLATISAERRQIAAARRAAERAEWAELTREPEGLVELLAEAKRAVAEALEAAGYHRHKRGEWRKRRDTKDKDQDQSPGT